MHKPMEALEHAGIDVPQIPDKLFFSISEAAKICSVEPHVLRYWESEFAHIKPVKNHGNRRLYRQGDIYTILYIKHLLYDLNFTIKGARKQLMSGNHEHAVEQDNVLGKLRGLRQELVSARAMLDS
ncbi:MAG: MerR family transcriptional regulator [Mariprofundales bacterium]